MSLALAVPVIALECALACLAHGGGLDAYGRHREHKHAATTYCHRGPFAGSAFTSKAQMLNSFNGKPTKGLRKDQRPQGGVRLPRQAVAAKMIRSLIALAALFVYLVASAQDHLPDPNKTPGALNTDVKQSNIQQTVCTKNWTDTVRPGVSFTNKLKKKQMLAGGLPKTMADYEEDHRVPLCAGGHPKNERNLWPQPRFGQWTAKDKDQLELSVCRALCKGKIKLKAARELFLGTGLDGELHRIF